MKRSSGIFREQALEAYLNRGEEPGDVLRIAPGWTRWVYALLVGVVLVAGIAAVFGRLAQYAEGPASVVGHAGEVRALLPARFVARLGRVVPARLLVDGLPGASVGIELEPVEPWIVGGPAGLRHLGLDLQRDLLQPGPWVALRGTLASTVVLHEGARVQLGPGTRGTLEATVGTQRILVALLPGAGDDSGGERP